MMKSVPKSSAGLAAASLLLAACAASAPEPEAASAPRRSVEEVWSQPLTGSSAAALAASEAQEGVGYLARLAALEEQIAEGVRQGQFTETDLAQVRARRARAEAELAATLARLGRAKARYNTVVGPPAD